MRSGRRIAFDVGLARVGVALSDFHAILATPVAHLTRNADLAAVIAEASKIVTENEAIEIYVGLPLNLKNESTLSTEDAVAFARALALQVEVAVRLIDERLTTTSAASALRSAGHAARSQKGLIDSAAAAVILEQAISQEKLSNTAPGIAIEDY
jgi:putative Holliday junction resolvase